MSRSPTSLSELLEARDDELAERLDRAVRDAAELGADLQAGNVEAARHMLVAVQFELDQMRGLLP